MTHIEKMRLQAALEALPGARPFCTGEVHADISLNHPEPDGRGSANRRAEGGHGVNSASPAVAQQQSSIVTPPYAALSLFGSRCLSGAKAAHV